MTKAYVSLSEEVRKLRLMLEAMEEELEKLTRRVDVFEGWGIHLPAQYNKGEKK